MVVSYWSLGALPSHFEIFVRDWCPLLVTPDAVMTRFRTLLNPVRREVLLEVGIAIHEIAVFQLLLRGENVSLLAVRIAYPKPLLIDRAAEFSLLRFKVEVHRGKPCPEPRLRSGQRFSDCLVLTELLSLGKQLTEGRGAKGRRRERRESSL